ncbi:hypothetical protein B296_00056209 [Ensete ventricosum]|uniref:Uncharacterized protein n=1 Tax=Ensete ventricosum TaxID=4639 RepID=A0A426WZ25_ENSVE|nr:hypothetical protein B296_00056209 [Ensete ventricosum]
MKTTIRVLVRGSSLIVNGRVVVPRGAVESPPLLDRGPSISFTHRGAVPTHREFADYDVDLSFDRVGRARLAISLRPPVWVVHSPLDIMTKVSLADQVLDLVLQVLTLFNVMAVFTVEMIVSAPIPFFGPGLDVVWWCQESLPPYLEEDLVHVELRGVVGGRWRLKSGPSILLLGSPEGLGDDKVVCPLYHLRDYRGVCVRDRPRLGGESVDELCEGFLPSLGDAEERGCRGLRSDVGKEVVGKTRHISASDKSYNVICAHKAATCLVGSKLPSYDSKTGSLKLVEIGLSRISGVKGDLCLELSAVSSFDLVTSFWTSSRHSFMRQSCTRNELVESDDRVSWSCGGVLDPKVGASRFFQDNRWGWTAPVHDPWLGSRRCNRDLGHGRGSGSRRGYFLGNPTGDQDAILRHGPSF